ncbi:aspartate-semialdehyde dehydrogenase [Alicyclobacillus sp. TC]|nr:aspartate-semialdehyde dehydrogenase [Alicyclobacillus sp. TC]QRF23675.1 aspartate-semialdehyde dehydrogenase [Alicyclobacillus sp. TC]
MNHPVRVAILGATGAVGRKMIEVLEQRNFPLSELRLLASPRSAGQTLSYAGEKLQVEAVQEDSFEGVDIALFSAGANTSKQYAPLAVRSHAVVVDNSSAYRMEEDVPLVVPEVNPHALSRHKGIIANPNCSTIQLVVVLHALRSLGLEEVVISTYQAVSGMGQTAIDALHRELESGFAAKESTLFPMASAPFYVPMAFNVLPQCDVFLENGYTKEEMKLVQESRKILEQPTLRVAPTAVRVPVVYGHSESVRVTFARPVSVEEVRVLLAQAEGVSLADRPEKGIWPHPRMVEGSGQTFVGRIRSDLFDERSVQFFIVADNLLKGAAYNAVQIAEELVKNDWFGKEH